MRLSPTDVILSNASLTVNPFAKPNKGWEALTKEKQAKEAKAGKAKKLKCTLPANYLVYDTHRDAPVGFAMRVGKKASVFLVDKMVAGKKMKIYVGLASGRKGAEVHCSGH